MRIKRIVSFTLAFLLTVIQPGLICFAISNEKDKIVAVLLTGAVIP